MWRDGDEAKEKILGPYQKDEVHQEPEAGVVTGTPLSRDDGWHS
jgi:hypothetical protein